MDASAIAIIGIVTLIILFLLKMPVAYAMGFVGFVGFNIMTSKEASFALLSKSLWSSFSSYSLTVIPMFIFMGSILSSAGIAEKLYRSISKITGQKLPGGIAIATTYACAAFGACCGSTAAATATMGKVALPAMQKYGYNSSLSAGCVASAGSLAILLPPSTALIVYGIITEQSIGKLFIAGIIPGIILSIMFSLAILIVCMINPKLAPTGEKSSLKDKFYSIFGLLDALVIFIIVMGGLIGGFFTPTEAGAAGASGAVLLSLVRRKLTLKGFLDAVEQTTKVSAMIFIILACAQIFGVFMAITRVPYSLSEWTVGLNVSPNIIMAFIIIGLLIGGCFMDALALVTLTVPILYPVIINLGFDPIWFGVMTVLTSEMGVITPPVGLNIYVLKSVAPETPLEAMFKGIFPFLLTIILCIAILIVFPQIATFLPQAMY